jgi:hypothetical protein
MFSAEFRQSIRPRVPRLRSNQAQLPIPDDPDDRARGVPRLLKINSPTRWLALPPPAPLWSFLSDRSYCAVSAELARRALLAVGCYLGFIRARTRSERLPGPVARALCVGSWCKFTAGGGWMPPIYRQISSNCGEIPKMLQLRHLTVAPHHSTAILTDW